MKKLFTRLALLFSLVSLIAQHTFAQVTYCTPASSCQATLKGHITSVKFNSLNSTSACGGYTLFPESGANTTLVERTATYQMEVGLYGYNPDPWHGGYMFYTQGVMVFVDFNADGDFDDAHEQIDLWPGNDSKNAKGDITIPANATVGKTRLRVRQVFSGPDAYKLAACNDMIPYQGYETEDYTITIVDKNPGVPACPSVFSPANNAVNIPRNSRTVFTWSGATGGSNTTYDFYFGESPSSLAAVGVNLISPDGYSGIYNYPGFLNAGTAYYYKVVPKNNEGFNTSCSIQKVTTAFATNDYYCTPGGNCSLTYDAYIKSVEINTLTNTSTCPGNKISYIHFPASGATTTSLTKGSTYGLQVKTSGVGGCNGGYLGAWIDFNQNGSFEDTGEFLAIPSNTTPGACGVPMVNVTIPEYAVTGRTRMRVRYNGSYQIPILADNSCMDFGVGETEDYTITILPATGCTSLTASYSKTDNHLSADEAGGSITVTPSGGTPAYTIRWTDGTTSGFNPTGLHAGIYAATITDGTGCTYTTPPININAPPVFKIDSITVIQASCLEGGKIRVDVSGGVGPYTFDWGNVQLSGNFNDNLPEGVYQVTVRDSKGLTLTSQPIEIHSFKVSYIKKDADCAFGNTGEIRLAVEGGIPIPPYQVYQYHWRREDTNETLYNWNEYLTGRPPGIYSVTIKDAAGCTLAIPEIIIGGPEAVVLTTTITPLNCNGNGSTTGEIWVSATKGQGPYRYELYTTEGAGAPFPAQYVEDEAGRRFIDIPASDFHYSVAAYDATGCRSDYAYVTINELTQLDPSWGFMNACSGQSAEIHYGGYLPGMNFIWYADRDGSIPLDTSAVFTTPLLTQSATYYLANYQNGCRTGIIPYVVGVVTAPAKPVIIHQGGTTLCGTNNVSLEAPSGFSGYRWSSGATTQQITVNAAGSFFVIVENDDGCESPASDPVSVIEGVPTLQPTVTASASTTFCAGGSVELMVSADFTEYNWSTGATSKNILVTQPGNYTVKVKQEGACESTFSNPVTVTVNPLPGQPHITADGPVAFCTGEVVTLSAPDGYKGYAWSNGATTQNITVSQSGDYAVVVSDGCESPMSALTAVTVSPLPAAPAEIVQVSATVLKAVGASEQYEWQLNNTVLEENTAEIKATESGMYSVRALSNEGCLSPGSVSYAFVVTGVEHGHENDLTLYPNPSDGVFKIRTGSSMTGPAEVSVINSVGQVMFVQSMFFHTEIQEINLAALSPGIYRIMIRKGERAILETVMIR
jgi:hypothetical protein